MKRINSTVAYFLFVMAVMGLVCARDAFGQTACTPNAPCVQVTITNPNPIPSPAVLWSCMGANTSCTLAALQTVLASQTATTLCPAVQSVWHCSQFSQTKTPQLYNDLEPWGALMNYATQGTTAGGVSAASPVISFQVPNQTPQSPSIGSLPAIVKTGVSGPQ